MIDWSLIFMRDLALAVWLGGLIVIDFVEAPAKFKVPDINRNQAVAVGRAVFAALLRLEVALGLLLVIIHLLARSRAATDALALRWQTSLLVFALMLAIVLLQKGWAIRRIQQASEGVDLVARATSAEVFSRMKRWHFVYVAGDLLKIALGLGALALWTG
jgi:uncharacterized membrane protein